MPVEFSPFKLQGPLAPIPGKKVFIKPVKKKEINIIETIKKNLDDNSSPNLR